MAHPHESNFFLRNGVGGKSLLTVASTLAIATASQPAFAQDDAAPAAEESGYGLNEIVVTAQKKTENLQDVAISVTALDSKALSQLNVSNFEDYIRYQPSVVAAGNGPGQSAYFIRGLATNLIDIGLSEIGGTSPNVALYLDEQPVSTISRNLDIYVTDIQRVEVLPGPQGTLFGASSQAGTVRLITNPPVLGELSASVQLGAAITRHGEESTSVEGYINIPVTDSLAVRAVAYMANRGGYIDNVPANLTLPQSNAGIAAGGNFLTRLQDPDVVFQSASNASLVEKDFNDARYQGFRLGALYEVSPDWSVRLQVMHQKLETEGVFFDDASTPGDGVITDQPNGAGEYAISAFYPQDMEDTFTQYSATIEGRIGALELLYAGAYLERNVEQRFDYAGYIDDGIYVAYYVCDYYAPATRAPICFDPTYGSNMDVRFTRMTHELRGSLEIGDRLSVIAGAFYDEAESGSDIRFIQPGIETLVQSGFGYYGNQVPILSPIPGNTTTNPNPREPGTTFFNDVIRKEDQFALFGEVTLDIIPDRLAVTGGLRYYNIDVSLGGSTVFVFGAVDIDGNLAGQSPAKQEDVIFKGNITWTPTDDLLFYATYSEGFRPGGFNRNGSNVIPFFYTSDSVKNYELGWKMQLFDRRLRFNGSMFQVDWSNMQLSIQDLSISNLNFIDNIGTSRIQGVEGDLAWSVAKGLTFYGSFAYTDAKLTSVPPSVVNLAPEGSQLAYVPKFQFASRARYEFPLSGELDGFAQLAVQHSGARQNAITVADRVRLDPWTTLDLSVGVDAGQWRLNLYAENLTDKRIISSVLTSDPRSPETIGRPRTIGARLSFDF